MVRVLLGIGRVSLSNALRNSDDCCRFGAQAARTELLEGAAGAFRGVELVLGEAAFGADEDRWPFAVGCWPRLFVRVEDDLRAFAFDDLIECCRLFDVRDARSSALLDRLED